MAGRFSVEAVFKAVDRITAPVSRMQNRVGKFTRGLTRGLRNANRALNKFTGGLRRGAALAAKFGGAILAAAGVAVVTAINRIADAADKLAKQSRRLQFPIEELQEWKFVSEQSGVSTELLDKSLGAFSKRLGEAANGTGPLVTGLKKLNPQLLKQLNQADSIASAFDIYIKAIRGADSATEKAALANAAFSRAGLELVNIADNSADAIKKLRLEQRQNGLITQEQAEAAEAYNDATNSLQKSLLGLLQNILLPMLPTITETVRAWREWTIANKDLIKSKVFAFVENLKTRIKDLINAVIEFNEKYNLAERLEEGLAILRRFSAFLERNGTLILTAAAAFVSLSLVLNTIIGVMTAVNLVMAANPITLIVLAIVAVIAAFAALVVWIDDVADRFDKLPGIIQFVLAPLGLLIKIIKLIKDNWEPLKTFFSDLWTDIAGIFNDGVAFIENILGKVGDAIGAIKDNWEPLKAFFSDLWTDIAGIFSNGVAFIENILGKVGDAIKFISGIGGAVADAFSFGAAGELADRLPEPMVGAEEERADRLPGQMVSPQERTARTIEESRETSTAEVTIRDDTGRAEQTGGTLGRGVQIINSGAF